MVKYFVSLVIFGIFSCDSHQNQIVCQLSVDKENEYIFVDLENKSNSNLYFRAKGLIFERNNTNSNSDSLYFIEDYPKLDNIYENKDNKPLKKIAYRNYFLASKFDKKNTNHNITIGDSMEYDLALFDKNYNDVVCTTFFFIKSKQHLILRFTLKDFETSIKDSKISFENWRNGKRKDKFYSFGKIGNFHPYTKDIKSEPIFLKL